MIMNDIDRLIKLNVELEGALRVLAVRPSPEAMDAAKEKFAQLSAGFATLQFPVEEPKSQPVPTPVVDITEHQQTTVKEDEAEGAESAPLVEPDDKDVPADEPIVESDVTAAEVARPDIRKTLTLNDRFLFSRELFNGSKSELDDTLSLIASMHSLPEAEEYIYDDLQLSPDDDTVKAFMAIIANYFKK